MGRLVYDVKIPAFSDEFIKRKAEIETENAKKSIPDAVFKDILHKTKQNAKTNKKLKKKKLGDKISKALDSSKVKTLKEMEKLYERNMDKRWYYFSFYRYIGKKTIRCTIYAPIKGKWIKRLAIPTAKYGWSKFSRVAKIKVVEQDDFNYLAMGMEMDAA